MLRKATKLSTLAALLGVGGAIVAGVLGRDMRVLRHDCVLGAVTEVVGPYPCDVLAQSPADAVDVRREGDPLGLQVLVLEARRAGEVTARCSDGNRLVYAFAQAARLELAGASRLVASAPGPLLQLSDDQMRTVEVRAFDASGGALEVGKLTGGQVRFEGVLEGASERCEFPPACFYPQAGQVRVRARQAGTGALVVSLPGAEARWTVTVTAPEGDVPR